MDKFYVIKLIAKNGNRGYLIDGPKEILISDGVTAAIKQFKSYQDAQQFLRDRKVERNGIKAYIRDNEDLMKEEVANGAKIMENDMFYLENEEGKKCFYDTQQKGYFFDSPDVGYCVWYTEEQVSSFVKSMEFDERTFIKKIEKHK